MLRNPTSLFLWISLRCQGRGDVPQPDASFHSWDVGGRGRGPCTCRPNPVAAGVVVTLAWSAGRAGRAWGYMVDFIRLFAPHFSTRMIRDVAAAPSQDEADELLREVALPIKGGCEQELAAAARY
jgi:hypothetical protein